MAVPVKSEGGGFSQRLGTGFTAETAKSAELFEIGLFSAVSACSAVKMC